MTPGRATLFMPAFRGPLPRQPVPILPFDDDEPSGGEVRIRA